MLLFGLVAIVAIRTGGHVWALFQPRPAPGRFEFVGGRHGVTLGGDGTIVSPSGQESYWLRYMRGASIQGLREDLEALLGI